MAVHFHDHMGYVVCQNTELISLFDPVHLFHDGNAVLGYHIFADTFLDFG